MVRSVRIVAAIETVSRVLGAIGSLYLDFTAFQGLQEYSDGQFFGSSLKGISSSSRSCDHYFFRFLFPVCESQHQFEITDYCFGWCLLSEKHSHISYELFFITVKGVNRLYIVWCSCRLLRLDFWLTCEVWLDIQMYAQQWKLEVCTKKSEISEIDVAVVSCWKKDNLRTFTKIRSFTRSFTAHSSAKK